MKNLLLAADCSVVDSVICPPPTVRPADLGDLLSVVAERLEPGGVLMLHDGWATDYLTPYAEQGGDQEPATLHAGDWSARVRRDDVWIRWTADKHSIWTCELSAVEPGGKSAPLVASNPIVTASQFTEWERATGVPWVGTPGMSGNALLVDGWREMNPKASEPLWRRNGIWYPLESNPVWPFGHIEQAYTPAQWYRDYSGPMHGYDLNMAYLSAYQVVELPVDALDHHTVTGPGADPFDPRIGGVWRVMLSPWLHGDVLPDPAGYAPALEDGSRWLTTQTLTLLQQLTDRGDYGGFTVLEWWGAPARRVTRKWASLIHDLITAGRPPLSTAAKLAYKQAYGMWVNPGRVNRPEWHYALIAQARTNLWRKMDTAYRGAASTLSGRGNHQEPPANYAAPVRVETDCIFYAGITDWERDAPYGLKLDESGAKLGHFKPYVPKEDR